MKAYCGFNLNNSLVNLKLEKPDQLLRIVTGNWGCGAFGCNFYVKFYQQWIAATLAGREMIYCTFSNPAFNE